LRLLTQFQAYLQLGLRNIFRVAVYRAGLKTGLHPVLRVQPPLVPNGRVFDFFERRGVPPEASAVWRDRPWAFGMPAGDKSGDPPVWHANILTGASVKNAGRNWNQIETFSKEIGDIKTVWEASRFDWVLTFAQLAASGDDMALEKLDRWLSDWNIRNPAYQGPNWMCGQEASIRVAHLLLGAIILGSANRMSLPVEAMILSHLRRILPTIGYALGQDNNHATSEAMALYAGGLWLQNCAETAATRREARKFVKAGLRLAGERVRSLIFDDGGFAQYSYVYHRLMLDSLSVMELARLHFDAPEFDPKFYEKASASSKWLRFFTEPQKGDVPNIGSNDGAWLLPIGPGSYRDFRPSCALASTLFENRTAFGEVESSAAMLSWLNIEPKKPIETENRPAVKIFKDSGIVALSKGDLRVYMRLPGTRFRPPQADALHVDIWNGDRDLLVDAGTYSYASQGWEYFQSTAAHNTIEFDRRDQMPRIGRFLFGSWLKRNMIIQDIQNNSVRCSYVDSWGCRHERHVSVQKNLVSIKDKIDGPFKSAILRWRFVEKITSMSNNTASSDSVSLCVTVDGEPIDLAQKIMPCSTHYHHMLQRDVAEIDVDAAGGLISVIDYS
jgi:hypothetical protein